jgi:hypothetical protein
LRDELPHHTSPQKLILEPLFVIVMEALNNRISTTIDGGSLSGFFVEFGEVNISHFLFVDDTLVCYEIKTGHLHYLHVLFLCFEDAFVLKIYLAISELVPVGNVENVDGLVDILGYGVSSLPMKYLGLSLEASYESQVYLGLRY